MSALIFADDRPTSCNDDLYQWAMDAEALIRNLHTENTALRVTEDNLRQELQECQDQRRAAFRRIEELDAMRSQIGQGEPVAYLDIGAVGYIDLGTDLSTEQLQALPAGRHMLGIIGTFGANGYVPAPQQKPLPDEQKIEMWTNATIECCTHMACYMRGIEDAEAAHNIGEKK